MLKTILVNSLNMSKRHADIISSDMHNDYGVEMTCQEALDRVPILIQEGLVDTFQDSINSHYIKESYGDHYHITPDGVSALEALGEDVVDGKDYLDPTP